MKKFWLSLQLKFSVLTLCSALVLCSCASAPKGSSAYFSEPKAELTANKTEISTKTPKTEPQKTVPVPSVNSPETQSKQDESEKLTAIKPKQSDSAASPKSHTYFSHIPQNIMADVENGSPASLRRAASNLRKSRSDFDESEKMLLAVESGIMQVVWPSERIDWESPAISTDTSYIGAINSAKKGIYDESTGNVDFLTIVLPSLVVLKTDDVSDFFEESEAALLEGLDRRFNSVLANYLLGVLYSKKEYYPQAIERLYAASQTAPECFQVNYSYAEVLYKAGKVQAAKEKIQVLLEKYSGNSSLLNLYAHISYDLKDFISAEQYVAMVLAQEPNNLDALLFRIKILVEKKDYIHAASLLDVYSRQENYSREYLLLRAQIQYDWSKNTSAAIQTIETALKNYPDDQQVLLVAAKLSSFSQLNIGGYSGEELANQVLAKDPQNQKAMEYAVECYIQKKEWNKAFELSNSLLNKSKQSSGSEYMSMVFRHVKICLALGKGDEAWNLIQPLYRNNSQNEDVIQWYIQTMVETGRSQQANNLINQLLTTSTSKLKSFLFYKRSFMQNTEDNALSDLRSSLIANPRNSDALFRLYQIYYRKSDYRKAQYYLKQVVALNPNDASIKKLNDELTRILEN